MARTPTTHVAVLQMNSQDDVSDNLLQAETLVLEAANAGAELVVLPEAFAFLGRESQKADIAETVDGSGPIVEALRKWSRRTGVALIAGGLPEKSEEDSAPPHNSSVVFDSTGEVVQVYRKMHLFNVALDDGTSWFESRGTSPGSEPCVARVSGRQVGLSICYDLRFPELFAWQRARGAELLTVPAAFTATTGAAHWHVLLRARAIETQCYVLAAAQEGEHPHGRRTYGHACIMDPWGRVIAERNQPGPGVVLGEVNTNFIEKVRTDMPMEEHRFPAATYGRQGP